MIDRERYPLTDRSVIAEARAQLRERGAAELAGFILPSAVEALEADCERLTPLAHWSEGVGPAYLEPTDPSLPAGHPRHWRGRHRLGVIAYDLIPQDCLLRQLYEWDPLREFVEAILGRGPIHRYSDPFGALNLAVMAGGDELQWHFDQTDFVVSLALRRASGGGDFEFAPRIRSDEQRVEEVLAGRRELVEVLQMAPGTLLLFEGRDSLHRVSPVVGPVSRLVALLAYDTNPEARGTTELHRERYGRTVAIR